MQAKALTANGQVVTGIGEVHGVNAFNDDGSLCDITLYDNTSAAGKILWKGRVALDASLTQLFNDGKGRGITCQIGVFLALSNDTDIEAQVYFT